MTNDGMTNDRRLPPDIRHSSFVLRHFCVPLGSRHLHFFDPAEHVSWIDLAGDGKDDLG
jgi:hypothetical protein